MPPARNAHTSLTRRPPFFAAPPPATDLVADNFVALSPAALSYVLLVLNQTPFPVNTLNPPAVAQMLLRPPHQMLPPHAKMDAVYHPVNPVIAQIRVYILNHRMNILGRQRPVAQNIKYGAREYGVCAFARLGPQLH